MAKSNSRAVAKLNSAIDILSKKRRREFNHAGISFASSLIEAINARQSFDLNVNGSRFTVSPANVRISKTKVSFTTHPDLRILLCDIYEGEEPGSTCVYDDDDHPIPIAIEKDA